MPLPPYIEERVRDARLGRTRKLKVRTVLSAFNQKRRRSGVVSRIEAALAEHGVKLDPPLNARGLAVDDLVAFVPLEQQTFSYERDDELDEPELNFEILTMSDPKPTYEAFREQWLADHVDPNGTSVQKGTAFATALLSQWQDIEDGTGEIVHCDGAGDGGVDAAVFCPADPGEEEDQPTDGDAWYIVQSKYGAAFAGEQTLTSEGMKVVRFLEGTTPVLNSLSQELRTKLATFRSQMGDADRLVLLMATVDPLTDAQRDALEMVRAFGRERLGARFEVESVSLKTLYEALDARPRASLRIPIQARVADGGGGLSVGVVGLEDLYSFLRKYRQATGDLDRLYERNVRRFLGGKGKVNREMGRTLIDRPEDFGLFNNGITVVADRVEKAENGELVLHEPSVVNGCQTTRTVWTVLDGRLSAGGQKKDETLEAWKARMRRGCVVCKIVSLEDASEELLPEITRFTNSQNKVQDKDFLALESDFQRWARQFETQHNIYLEIQRGGWESRRAWQKQNPSEPALTQSANAAELLKVLAAGWHNQPGRAMAENKKYLPGGTSYREITSMEGFGAQDLYAAYLLKTEKDRLGFGGKGKATRGQTKFLFYCVFISLLRHVLNQEGLPADQAGTTRAVVAAFAAGQGQALADLAAGVVDDYMTPGDQSGAAGERLLTEREKGDMNAFLKSSELRPDGPEVPNFRDAVRLGIKDLGRNGGPALVAALRAALC